MNIGQVPPKPAPDGGALLSKNIEIDDYADTATIYGAKISGGLLRAIGEPTRPGEWFRVTKDGEISTVQWKREASKNLLCKIIGHSLFSLDPLRGVAGPLKCKRCAYETPGIVWPHAGYQPTASYGTPNRPPRSP